ncbi:MAG: hypothetical protein A2655_04850 [Candidatus Yanofskybacteria bacterium RIFCSPHIGHO2_01_FULL_43_42]|uniref:Cell division protein FtsL n=1 Tax=Candidatus Yanofskybacteria bacterium RIFCSPLOWO2_01_FULL_43_22 TaxID=1802695 RepID=A0A1F8GD15_9BACT|nr:MAG: hypothetical protein A2655_04850 [Candidatus Yanofskybacteria bacterium RIFCSPHIGHO2_01_FULL_43_42]OGN12634.1 MAG: hypothetical protein A3D48_01230 [Candidatus Yanofskybacteria bacterium RIFCSPHIGHO2_02_FULL_43_17]OGN23257.1 MAG: hypothetical protein A3A13_03995 [Candidatus Yanofskybacteria bacterium RIFCSPLOWO2_01_FULL_43_22]
MKQPRHNTTALNYTGTGVFNVFLLAAVIFLMMYFVVVSNIITSSSYRIGVLTEELSGLTEINGLLTAQKLSIEDSSMLSFAQGQNMVQATHVSHIFESGNVALQQ